MRSLTTAPTAPNEALSVDDVLAVHLASALSSWTLSHKERLKLGGDLAKHLLQTAADAVCAWGDRPLPGSPTAALDVLENITFPNTGPSEEQQNHARLVRALARHAQAWSRDKKNQIIPPGKRSRAVALLQRAVENGHQDLVEGLLDAADAPVGAVNEWWWKLPEKPPAAGWQAVIAPQGGSAKVGLALGAVALAVAQANWKNTFFQSMTQEILARGDPARPVTATGVNRLALCANGEQLASVLALLPPGTSMSSVEQDLLTAERLGYPLGMQWWFRALYGARPDLAVRIAPALLEQHIARTNPAALEKTQASRVLDAWVEVASVVPLPFECIRLPASGQPLSAAVARFAVLKASSGGCWVSPEEAWRRLAEEGVPMEASAQRLDADGWPEGLWWSLWKLQKTESASKEVIEIWADSRVSAALEEAVARPDLAPRLGSALVRAVSLLSDEQWPLQARTRVLDAWALALLSLKPGDAGLVSDQLKFLWEARKADPEPLGAQWIPIAATRSVHLPRPTASAITAEQIGNALDRWSLLPWPASDSRDAVFRAVRLDWEWGPSVSTRQTRRM